MSLTDEQRGEIQSIIKENLDRAEKIWNEHRTFLSKSALDEESFFRADSAMRELVPSRIPDYPIVDSENPKVGKFIALVADVRQSSQHLLCSISKGGPKIDMLERVHHEMAALLPALEQTVYYQGGSVTEYLGDGILAIFTINEENKEEYIKKSYRAAKNCIGDTRRIVNDELQRRYSLPPLDIGVGMAMSQGIVDVVGVEGRRHAKVIGPCVYYASKLSCGSNEIIVNNTMYNEWPTSEGGRLKFTHRNLRKTSGYLVV